MGPLLGPVLVLLYINGCLSGLSCDAVVFVDDLNIWRAAESPSEVQNLQSDIDLMPNWSQGALVSFKADKCIILTLHP